MWEEVFVKRNPANAHAPHESAAGFEIARAIPFRRWPVLLIISAGVFVGIALQSYLDRPSPPTTSAQSVDLGFFERPKEPAFVLPGQAHLTAVPHQPGATLEEQGLVNQWLRIDGPVIANLWPSKCADCLRSFKHWSRQRERLRSLAVHIINITSRPADRSTLAKFGLSDELAFDDAGVLEGLHIDRFTTVMFDAHGNVRFIDDPTKAGFVQRLTGAWATLRTEPRSAKEDLRPLIQAEQLTLWNGASAGLVQAIVKRHVEEFDECIEGHRFRGLRLPVSWRITPDGYVVDAQVTDPRLRNLTIEKCVLGVVSSWRFPAQASVTTQRVAATFDLNFTDESDFRRWLYR